MRTRLVPRLFVVLGASLVLETSCGGGGGGGGSALTVYGRVTDYEDEPVAGMYVTAERVDDPIHVDPRTLEAVRTGEDGAFELTIAALEPRLVVVVLPERAADGAIAHAPTMGIVRTKAGVSEYELPLRVPSVKVFDAASGRIDVGTATAPMTLTAPPGATGRFHVTGIDVTGGIPLEEEGAPPDTRLQSAGMLYLEPAPGSDVPAGGFGIELGGAPPASVPDAAPFAVYRLGGSGAWTKLGPSPDLGAVPPIREFGFWNCDRSVRTACVKGRLKASPGKTCGGRRVLQSGPNGQASQDNAGADGAFCVTGAQANVANVRIGKTRFLGTMPNNPGDCTSPETCADVGEIDVSAADCPRSAGASPSASPRDAGGEGDFSCDAYVAGDPGAPPLGACTAATVTELCTRYGQTGCPNTYAASGATFVKALTSFCAATALNACCDDAKQAQASRAWKEAHFKFIETGGEAPGEPKYCTFFGYCEPLANPSSDPAEVAACKEIAAELDACNDAAWPFYDAWNGYADACDAEKEK